MCCDDFYEGLFAFFFSIRSYKYHDDFQLPYTLFYKFVYNFEGELYCIQFMLQLLVRSIHIYSF